MRSRSLEFAVRIRSSPYQNPLVDTHSFRNHEPHQSTGHLNLYGLRRVGAKRGESSEGGQVAGHASTVLQDKTIRWSPIADVVDNCVSEPVFRLDSDCERLPDELRHVDALAHPERPVELFRSVTTKLANLVRALQRESGDVIRPAAVICVVDPRFAFDRQGFASSARCIERVRPEDA
jgi:hypothetical protein